MDYETFCRHKEDIISMRMKSDKTLTQQTTECKAYNL